MVSFLKEVTKSSTGDIEWQKTSRYGVKQQWLAP
jgi:hypothetical protein